AAEVPASSFDGDAVAPLAPQFSQKALDDWRAAVRMIIESGWRFQVHTTRNHSAEQLLPAIEEINREIPVANRRLGFAHLEDVTPDTVRRIKALGGGIAVRDRRNGTGAEAARSEPGEVARTAPPPRRLRA